MPAKRREQILAWAYRYCHESLYVVNPTPQGTYIVELDAAGGSDLEQLRIWELQNDGTFDAFEPLESYDAPSKDWPVPNYYVTV